MDIFAALRAENARILKVLNALEHGSAGRPEERERLLRELDVRLRAEHRLEDELLYPLLSAYPETRPDAARSREEIREIEAQLDELEGIPARETRFQRSAEVLHALVRDHLRREEHQVFPKAARVVPEDEAALLGERFERERRILERSLQG